MEERTISLDSYVTLEKENDMLKEKIDTLLKQNKELLGKDEIHRIEQNQCLGITKKGFRCGQRGSSNQSGGSLINGYCKYHR